MKSTNSKTLLPAIAAAGGVLSAAPAGAIQLGEIEVHSRLGQPLRASIAYALGPNEQLYDFCISLSQGIAEDGMPAVRRATVSVANGVISLTGRTPIREPLMTTRVIVDCPYTAHISREYLMFIDPASSAETQEIATPQPLAAQPVAPAAAVAAPAARVTRPAPAAITNATRYQVQPGDTLSGIAQRIEDRPVGLWDAVNQIFAANPDAFIDNDMNRLKAGSWLSIPDFGADSPMLVAETQAQPTAQPYADQAAEPPLVESVVPEAQLVEQDPDIADQPIQAPAESASDITLQPGDIILDADVEAPEITAQTPNQPEARIVPPAPVADTRSSYAWMLWLGGAGLVIIAGLLLFGRRLREFFGSSPVGPEAAAGHALHPDGDEDTQNLDAYSIARAAEEPLIDDDSPTEENLALDANVVTGAGLQEGSGIEVAEDFAFAATTALDFELPEEMSSTGDTTSTDIIAPMNVEEATILESEVLPEDDDYDMSVIVDATKMPSPEEVTERDLQAVVVDDDEGTLIDDSYTVSKEIDYKILEQDYEDELTATQRLNEELARAANELADRLDEGAVEEATSEMTMATVTELDVTSQLPAQNDDGDEATIELSADDKTVEMPAEETTVEMPKADKAG